MSAIEIVKNLNGLHQIHLAFCWMCIICILHANFFPYISANNKNEELGGQKRERERRKESTNLSDFD